jgi:hypothetical protein
MSGASRIARADELLLGSWVGVIRRPTSFPASLDGSLKDV